MTTTISGVNGVDNIAPGTILQEDASTLMLPLGVGQTWQDVTASRTFNTPYTNNTGRPIYISLSISQGGLGVGDLVVGGVVVSRAQPSSSAEVDVVTAIVPSGAVYRYNVTGGAQTLLYWSELR